MPHREIKQNRNERLRGYVVYLLYCARPSALELAQLQRLLDARNFPVSRRRLAEELAYLRDADLLLVAPHATGKLDGTIDWIERFADSDDDLELGDRLRARLTLGGVRFQEQAHDTAGVARVE